MLLLITDILTYAANKIKTPEVELVKIPILREVYVQTCHAFQMNDL